MTWSDLPVDLLHCISSHLHIIDFLHFFVVCSSWNSSFSNNALRGIHCRPSPWLLLPNDAGEASDTLTFHDLTIEEEEEDGVNIHYRFSSLTGYIYGRRCIGSKDGWLVTLDKIDMQPRIFNPLTKAEISLPSLFTIPDKYYRIKLDDSSEFFYDELDQCFATDVEWFRDVYFRKIVMSSNDPFGTVVVIYGYIKFLALLRPNDTAWVLGPQLPPYHIDKWVDFEDVYYHEEEHRFYAITHFSAVLAFDLSGHNVELICPPIHDVYAIDANIMNYIAFLFGNLIKIEREVERIDLHDDESMTVKTIRISVLKLLPDVDTWIPIKDLGDFSLFVGCNQTFSLHHTVAPGIRRNCVYFTDHVENLSPNEATRDAGFFDLHNDCFHYFLDSESQPNWPPSIWFMPSFS